MWLRNSAGLHAFEHHPIQCICSTRRGTKSPLWGTRTSSWRFFGQARFPQVGRDSLFNWMNPCLPERSFSSVWILALLYPKATIERCSLIWNMETCGKRLKKRTSLDLSVLFKLSCSRMSLSDSLPCFLWIYLNNSVKQYQLNTFGDMGCDLRVLLCFMSANPTSRSIHNINSRVK